MKDAYCFNKVICVKLFTAYVLINTFNPLVISFDRVMSNHTV